MGIGENNDLRIQEELFKEVRYFITGVVPDKVRTFLSRGGGKQESHISDFMTHLITGSNPDENEVSLAKDIYEKTAVTHHWVLYSGKCGKQLPLEGFLPEENQIFSHVKASVSNLSGEDSKSIWSLLSYHGGKFSLDLDQTCTHLICGKPQGVKYERAIEKDLHIVTPDWVSESVESGERKEEFFYHPRLLNTLSPPPEIHKNLGQKGRGFYPEVNPSPPAETAPVEAEFKADPIEDEIVKKMKEQNSLFTSLVFSDEEEDFSTDRKSLLDQLKEANTWKDSLLGTTAGGLSLSSSVLSPCAELSLDAVVSFPSASESLDSSSVNLPTSFSLGNTSPMSLNSAPTTSANSAISSNNELFGPSLNAPLQTTASVIGGVAGISTMTSSILPSFTSSSDSLLTELKTKSCSATIKSSVSVSSPQELSNLFNVSSPLKTSQTMTSQITPTHTTGKPMTKLIGQAALFPTQPSSSVSSVSTSVSAVINSLIQGTSNLASSPSSSTFVQNSSISTPPISTEVPPSYTQSSQAFSTPQSTLLAPTTPLSSVPLSNTHVQPLETSSALPQIPTAPPPPSSTPAPQPSSIPGSQIATPTISGLSLISSSLSPHIQTGSPPVQMAPQIYTQASQLPGHSQIVRHPSLAIASQVVSTPHPALMSPAVRSPSAALPGPLRPSLPGAISQEVIIGDQVSPDIPGTLRLPPGFASQLKLKSIEQQHSILEQIRQRQLQEQLKRRKPIGSQYKAGPQSSVRYGNPYQAQSGSIHHSSPSASTWATSVQARLRQGISSPSSAPPYTQGQIKTQAPSAQHSSPVSIPGSQSPSSPSVPGSQALPSPSVPGSQPLPSPLPLPLHSPQQQQLQQQSPQQPFTSQGPVPSRVSAGQSNWQIQPHAPQPLQQQSHLQQQQSLTPLVQRQQKQHISPLQQQQQPHLQIASHISVQQSQAPQQQVQQHLQLPQQLQQHPLPPPQQHLPQQDQQHFQQQPAQPLQQLSHQLQQQQPSQQQQPPPHQLQHQLQQQPPQQLQQQPPQQLQQQPPNQLQQQPLQLQQQPLQRIKQQSPQPLQQQPPQLQQQPPQQLLQQQQQPPQQQPPQQQPPQQIQHQTPQQLQQQQHSQLQQQQQLPQQIQQPLQQLPQQSPQQIQQPHPSQLHASQVQPSTQQVTQPAQHQIHQISSQLAHSVQQIQHGHQSHPPLLSQSQVVQTPQQNQSQALASQSHQVLAQVQPPSQPRQQQIVVQRHHPQGAPSSVAPGQPQQSQDFQVHVHRLRQQFPHLTQQEAQQLIHSIPAHGREMQSRDSAGREEYLAQLNPRERHVVTFLTDYYLRKQQALQRQQLQAQQAQQMKIGPPPQSSTTWSHQQQQGKPQQVSQLATVSPHSRPLPSRGVPQGYAGQGTVVSPGQGSPHLVQGGQLTPQQVTPLASPLPSPHGHQSPIQRAEGSALPHPALHGSSVAQNLVNQSNLVNPKTKTALANLLTNRLSSSVHQSGVPQGSQGPIEIATHIVQKPGSSEGAQGEQIIVYQRRPMGNITGSVTNNLRAAAPGPTGSQPHPMTGVGGSPTYPRGGAATHTAGASSVLASATPHYSRPLLYGHDINMLPRELCMVGCVFYIADYHAEILQETINSWKRVIQLHGGEVVNLYEPSRVTHFLCKHQKSPLFAQAVRDNKRCITAEWVNDILIRGKMAAPWQAIHLPTPFGNDEQPLKDMIISMSGFENEERASIKQMLWKAGAKYTGYFSRHNHVLVCKRFEGPKINKAREYKRPVVNGAWLSDVLLGNNTPPLVYQATRYQTILEDPLTTDSSLASHLLLNAWKFPITVSKELVEKAKAVREMALRKRKNEKEGDQENKRTRGDPLSLSNLLPTTATSATITTTATVTTTATTPTNSSTTLSSSEDKSSFEALTSQIIKDEISDYIIKPKILLSSMKNKAEMEKKIVELGGSVARTNSEATHLVVGSENSAPRTIKLMCSVSCCQHVLTSLWLIDSHIRSKFLPESYYALKMPEFEHLFEFNLQDTLKKPNRRLLFNGRTFYLTPSVAPGRVWLKEIIECAGGLVDSKRKSLSEIKERNRNDYVYICIAAKKDLHLLQDILQEEMPVYNSEFVMISILRQRIDTEFAIMAHANEE